MESVSAKIKEAKKICAVQSSEIEHEQAKWALLRLHLAQITEADLRCIFQSVEAWCDDMRHRCRFDDDL